jgi:hypothetical protein
MRPQANLLLALGRQALALGHVVHVPNGNGARFALLRPIHHCPTHLVFNIAGTLLLLGQEAILAGLELLPAARAFLFARLGQANLCHPLHRVLASRTEPSRGDHDDLCAVRHGRRVNLAQVYGDNRSAGRRGWLTAVFQRDVPVVPPPRAVPHQLYLFVGTSAIGAQIVWQRDANRLQPTCPRQAHHASMHPDSGVLPGGRAVDVAPMRRAHVQPHPLLALGDLTGSIEALLRRVTAVGVPDRGAAEKVLHPLGGIL